MAKLNTRQWELYNAIKANGDRYVKQEALAEILPAYARKPHEDGWKYHSCEGRRLMTRDIQAINDDPTIQKVIISSGKGVKLANDAEFYARMASERSEAIRMLARVSAKMAKGNADGQRRIVMGQEREVIEALLHGEA